MGMLTKTGSWLTASMLRDTERLAPAKGEHILRDMVEWAETLGVDTPVSRAARCHADTYAARGKREPEAA